MNKAEMIEKITNETNLAKADVTRVISCFLDSIKGCLKDQAAVKLVGFGTFVATERKARTGRNPHTNEEMHIPARISPKFKPGKDFKEFLN